jgi:hypothetical protein
MRNSVLLVVLVKTPRVPMISSLVSETFVEAHDVREDGGDVAIAAAP